MSIFSDYKNEIIHEGVRDSRNSELMNFLNIMSVRRLINTLDSTTISRTANYSIILKNTLKNMENVVLSSKEVYNMIKLFARADINFRKYQIVSHDFNLDPIEGYHKGYLIQYVNILKKYMDYAMADKIEPDTEESLKAFMDNALIGVNSKQLKKQVITTNVPYSYSVENIAEEFKIDAIVDTTFVRTNILYLLKNNDKMIKTVMKEIEYAANEIDQARELAYTLSSSVEKYIIENNIDKKKKLIVMETLTNGMHAFVDTCSFVSYVLVRKMEGIVDASIQTRGIYDKIMDNLNPIIEAADTDEIKSSMTNKTDLSPETFIEKLNDLKFVYANKIDYYLHLLNIHSNLTIPEINMKLGEYHEYDVTIYMITLNRMPNMMSDFKRELRNFKIPIRKTIGYTTSISELTKRCPTMENLENFEKVAINIIQNNMNNKYPVIQLITALGKVVNFIDSCIEDIMEINDSILTPVDTIMDNNQQLNIELNEFIESYRNHEFVYFMKIVYNLLNYDLHTIESKLDKRLGVDPTSANLVIDERNYNTHDITSRFLVEEDVELTNTIFAKLELEYYVLHEKNEKGLNIVFEDEATNNGGSGTTSTTTNTGSTSNTPTQSTNNTNNTNNTQQTSNKPANNTNNDNSAKNTTSGKNIVNKINEWFKAMTQRLDDVVLKFKEKGNDAYFIENKRALLEKNYSNLSNKTPIINYEKMMPAGTMIGDMTKLVGKTNSAFLSPQKLQSLGDTSSIRKTILPSLPEKVWKDYDGDQLSKGKAITNYYKNGTYDENRVTVKSGELKAMVEQAVNYCESFFTKTYPTLKSNMEKITNNLSTTVQTLVNEGTSDIIGGFIVNEDEATNNGSTHSSSTNATSSTTPTSSSTQQPAKNTLSNMTDKVSEIEALVQIYCSGLITAAFDRYKDYFTLCTSVIPRTTNNKNNENSNNNTPTADNSQSVQNNNNNGTTS